MRLVYLPCPFIVDCLITILRGHDIHIVIPETGCLASAAKGTLIFLSRICMKCLILNHHRGHHVLQARMFDSK